MGDVNAHHISLEINSDWVTKTTLSARVVNIVKMALISKTQLELFTKSDEQALEIAKELMSLDCCLWCIIRFLGENRFSMYNEETYKQTQIVLAVLPDGKEIIVCPVCLGILQRYYTHEFLQEISRSVKKEDFEYVDYQCAMVVPVSTIIRQHSIYLHLQEKFDSIYSKIPEDEISNIKDVWKWLCGRELSHQLNSGFKVNSSFEISLVFNYLDSEKECNFLLSTNPNEFQRRKKSSYEIFTRAAVSKSVSCLPNDLFRKYYQCPCLAPVKEITCDIFCTYEAVFIAGRYQKLSRTLSQTPWIIDGERKTKSSVEEEICNCLTLFNASEFRFSSSGREDVDVRMLGKGRPFIVEILNCHNYSAVKQLTNMQKEINSRSEVVKVRDLQLVSREDTLKLKEGELEKSKCYLALCWASAPLTKEQIELINNQKDLEIHQKTPLRVLHRRSQATRPRMVYKMCVEDTKDNYFKLVLSTQAGTYIKEFIHGDYHRTVPNLSALINMDCDILTLDVSDVELNWPPSLEENDLK